MTPIRNPLFLTQLLGLHLPSDHTAPPRDACCHCGGEIGPGRPGRACGQCRQGWWADPRDSVPHAAQFLGAADNGHAQIKIKWGRGPNAKWKRMVVPRAQYHTTRDACLEFIELRDKVRTFGGEDL